MQNKNTIHFVVIAFMILLAVSTRFFSFMNPALSNFTAVGAMGLFGAAYFRNKIWAFIVPFLAMFLSDLILNNVFYAQYYDGFTLFSPGAIYTYGGFLAIVLIGLALLRKVSSTNVVGASVLAAFAFFLISNFGVWAGGTMYPKTMAGLGACYTAGLPFLKNTLISNLVYAGILFGVYEMVIRPIFSRATA